jgi:DNA repair protein RecN (Recombination protein N)
MLKSLTVANYALIEKADIAFHNGFSVITGETGAGKSILLGALGLILGQRADADVLKDKTQKCVVEATFDVSEYGLEPFLKENEVDYDPMTVIRREILPAGKSRAFVNDTPVNLTVLKDLTSRLIDIHSQHQTLLLAENHYQLMVVDVIAASQEIKTRYKHLFHQYRDLQNKLQRLVDENTKQKSDQDYITFQLSQLENAKLIDGEQEELESKLQQLTHSAEIKASLVQSTTLLDGEGQNILEGLRGVKVSLARIQPFLPEVESYAQRIEAAYIDLKDMSAELAYRTENIDHQPDELIQVQQRLDLIFDLQQKHRVGSVAELLAIAADYRNKLSKIIGFEEELAELQTAIGTLRIELSEMADQLTQRRQTAFPIIEQSLQLRLTDLGIPNARLQVSHQLKNDFSEEGQDDIVFLFSANKSGTPAGLDKVASGGEMSRLMLCIKALISSAKGLPTLLLDEIDTGVSGEIADKMGIIMAEMATNIQVISITHLPQIAGRGKNHYKVFKTDDGGQTVSKIELLNNDQRITEIAKMLSGSELSDAALTNARELLRN